MSNNWDQVVELREAILENAKAINRQTNALAEWLHLLEINTRRIADALEDWKQDTEGGND
jgi:hypothetical protein